LLNGVGDSAVRLLSVAYGTMRRASEVVALKVGGIDSQRISLRIGRTGRRNCTGLERARA
jgi:integrase